MRYCVTWLGWGLRPKMYETDWYILAWIKANLALFSAHSIVTLWDKHTDKHWFF